MMVVEICVVNVNCIVVLKKRIANYIELCLSYSSVLFWHHFS